MPRARARRIGGFTLLELLVTLALIGILLTIAVTGLRPPAPGELLDQEARRLQRLVQLAGEEAVLRARIYGVRMNGEGYAFVARDGERWRAITEAPLSDRQFTGTVRLQLPPPAPSGRPPGEPQLWLFPDGQMTPFELELRADGLTRRISGTSMGAVTIEAP